MNIRSKALALLGVALGLAAFQAKADTLVYDNGPINGTIDARTINNSWVVSDSFAVTDNVNLSMATVGLWLSPGATPTSVDWAIGTTAFGSDISNGTSSLTNTFFGTGFGYYDIYSSSFGLSGALSSGTTYYFTLSNAVASDGGFVFWDSNNGPSTGEQSDNGRLIYNPTPYGSQSFQLYAGSSVPDNGTTLTLLGGALLGLAALRRRFVS